MHEMTRVVRELIPQLEREHFSADRERREQLIEIQVLARQQVEDDTDKAARGQVGRSKVESFAWALEQSDLLYPARTPDQYALEEGLQPLLDSALTGEQRVLVRWRYAAMYTERQIATLSDITHQAVHQRLTVVHGRLREVLLTAFGPPKEEKEEVT